MTTHAMTAFDSQHTIYNDQTYVRTTFSSTRNQLFQSPTMTLPIPSINFCDYLLYETKIAPNVCASPSSYSNSNEHYDFTDSHTYDNPIECFESYNIKQSLINLPQGNGNLCDNSKDEKMNDEEKYGSSRSPHSSTSPILFYLENKRLALYACLISLLLLFIIGIGIFLLNKLIRPIVIATTVNNHYDTMNISNTSTISSNLLEILTQSSTSNPVSTTTIDIDGSPLLYSMCPPDHWGVECKNSCKPCGLGVCHPITGKCICPEDIYGEYCDLSKVNDKPKRGDMMN